jgi:hypothetical protein
MVANNYDDEKCLLICVLNLLGFPGCVYISLRQGEGVGLPPASPILLPALHVNVYQYSVVTSVGMYQQVVGGDEWRGGE